jgi:segregation and condensation protein A
MKSEEIQLAISLRAFDGPLDLLLNLVRKHEYPIDDLPVAAITQQFLAYVRAAEDLEMDLGGEFMETASWLVLLKSRSLLPREAARHAQQELRQRLETYEADLAKIEAVKDLLPELRGQRERVPVEAAQPARRAMDVDEIAHPTAAEVVRRLESAIASLCAAASFETEHNSLSVQQQMAWIHSRIDPLPPGSVISTAPWFDAQIDKEARASLLLAVLEMAKAGDVLVRQTQMFGTILLKKSVLAGL